MERGEKETRAVVRDVVVDTNIVISALIPKYSKLRDVILSGQVKFYAPEYLLKEQKYWEVIVTKGHRLISILLALCVKGSSRHKRNPP